MYSGDKMIFNTKCPYCGKTLTDSLELYHHLRSFHDKTIEGQLKQRHQKARSRF